MPKDTTKPTTPSSQGKKSFKKATGHIVFTYKTRQMALPKSLLESHAKTTKLVQEIFELNSDQKIIFETTDLPGCENGASIEVPAVAWTHFIPLVTKISVATRAGEAPQAQDPVPLPPVLVPSSDTTTTTSAPMQESIPVPPAHPQPSSAMLTSPTHITLTMSFASKTATVSVSRKAKVKSLKKVFAKSFERGCRCIRFHYKGGLIDFDKTPIELNMVDGDVIDVLESNPPAKRKMIDVMEVFEDRVAEKPIIYIFPPKGCEEMDVSVSVSLVPQWKFSAIYPLVPVQPRQLVKSMPGECVTWDVRTHRDKTMTEKSTGLTVSYLYWEASTQGILPSPPDSPRFGSGEHPEEFGPIFDPISSDLADNDNISVVLPLSRVTLYLDAALKELGLHTEARTSFITYWLPSFNKHTHIALRFVSQNAYERAAPLTVLPKPDVVVRVFMLFKGVPGSDVECGLWSNAAARGVAGVERWRDVVGLDGKDGLSDESLFRVLEWGGMEVRR